MRQLDGFPAHLENEHDLVGPKDSTSELQQAIEGPDYVVTWPSRIGSSRIDAQPSLEVNQGDIRSQPGKLSSKAPSTVVLEDRGDRDYLARKRARSDVSSGRPRSDAGSSSASGDVRNKPLDQRLRAALISSRIRPDKKFLPRDDLDRILTYESVHRALETMPVESPSETARQICRTTRAAHTGSTCREKLFAIMVLIDTAADMPKLIQEDLFDCDLPFGLEDPDGGSPYLVAKTKDGSRKLEFCKYWGTVSHENFYETQWKINVPYFEFSQVPTTCSQRVGQRRLILDQNDVLPIVSCELIKSGYFSDVYKVQFHQAHHSPAVSSVRPRVCKYNTIVAMV